MRKEVAQEDLSRRRREHTAAFAAWARRQEDRRRVEEMNQLLAQARLELN